MLESQSRRIARPKGHRPYNDHLDATEDSDVVMWLCGDVVMRTIFAARTKNNAIKVSTAKQTESIAFLIKRPDP